jgi:uncharacterized membrane protein
MNNKMKNTKTKLSKWHIAIIIIGIIFNGIGIIHSNLWFDEAYSVGIASHNWIDIWNIGGHDVHPILYYWILSLINVISGGNIIAYRIFSLTCIALLSILGYTHIRKDFGEKTGILFSFFSLFLPEICIFANEIRMYSLAILLVTICAIYAYRIFKGDTSWKNWIIFEISSLACLYVHYYGLMVAGLIHMIMLINFIKNHRAQSIKRIVIFGIVLVALYIPWLVYFVGQLKYVSKGFWIGFEFPKTVIELLSYQYIGNLNYYVGFAISILLYIYLGIQLHKIKKDKENILPVKLAIGVYIAVIIAALLVTVCAKTSILLYRYLFVITGLYIFTLSFILARSKNKKIVVFICILTAILAIVSNVKMINVNYNSQNAKSVEYLKNNIQPNDVIVYTDIGSGSIIAVNIKDNKQYYYNEQDWGVQEAYKAFGPQMDTYITSDFINELSGRIWIIDGISDECYQKYFNNEQYKFISQQSFSAKYHEYNYIITLVEK